ncbi:hypothetical protein GGR42_001473 [Saonia flava]|uniref:Uncharacterized protein n=1 Tax=Saonia flava TaxID=523696 RepID=A0A846QS95_9FLAO|nr:hypothetical protein [Saonia flava]NJB71011.1 hypothetical protein [Saonia flava]
MKLDFSNSLELLKASKNEHLYEKLIDQLNKDFQLANIQVDFSKEFNPKGLKTLLHEKVYYLILEKFTEYLNLLYVIDVSEKTVKKITSIDAVDVSEEITFLILKREFQKVWYKSKYTS